MEKHRLYTPEQLWQICNSQVEAKIRSGFHTRLKLSEDDFKQSYRQAIETIVLGEYRYNGLPTLVEPRIPFFEQTQLLGIAVNPAVFYKPLCDRQRSPYGIWVKVIDKEDNLIKQGFHFDKITKMLPDHLRPATCYEGINADSEALLKYAFVIFPNGLYERIPSLVNGVVGVRMLALERFCGVPRITHYYSDYYDSLGGVLAAYK